MLALGLDALRAATFRANPSYELVPFGALRSSQRAALVSSGEAPHAVLRPRAGAMLSVKALDRGAATLFAAATDAAPMRDLIDWSAANAATRIAALVLDHVLEIEHDGAFVCGPHAHALLLAAGQGSDDATTSDRIARLSHDALRIAAALPVDDPLSISRRLYAANALPITPAWKRRLPSSDAIAAWLGIDGASAATWTRAGWSRVETTGRSTVWAAWSRAEVASGAGDERARYKIYVSVRPDHLPDVLRAVVPALDETHAGHFKVGRTLRGLLRPDKLVIYFYDDDARIAAVDAIARAVSPFAAAAQGTPFTAALHTSGLLSWGFDPPSLGTAVAWRGRESWRLWVTNRLATYLVAGRVRAEDGVPSRSAPAPWRFALDRLALDGVDVATWSPRFVEGAELAR